MIEFAVASALAILGGSFTCTLEQPDNGARSVEGTIAPIQDGGFRLQSNDIEALLKTDLGSVVGSEASARNNREKQKFRWILRQRTSTHTIYLTDNPGPNDFIEIIESHPAGRDRIETRIGSGRCTITWKSEPA